MADNDCIEEFRRGTLDDPEAIAYNLTFIKEVDTLDEAKAYIQDQCPSGDRYTIGVAQSGNGQWAIIIYKIKDPNISHTVGSYSKASRNYWFTAEYLPAYNFGTCVKQFTTIIPDYGNANENLIEIKRFDVTGQIIENETPDALTNAMNYVKSHCEDNKKFIIVGGYYPYLDPFFIVYKIVDNNKPIVINNKDYTISQVFAPIYKDGRNT